MSRTTKFSLIILLAIPVFNVCPLALEGNPAPPAPTPIIATTTDQNFLDNVVGKQSCQTQFDLAIVVSGTSTHYRYKVGPSATTIPGVLTGYSAPIPKAAPLSFNISGQADGGYVLCLQGLKLDKKGNITSSQPLNQATVYRWTKSTLPVEYQLTFKGKLQNQDYTGFWAINSSGTAVGRSAVPGEGYHAIRWTPQNGLQDISTLVAPWLDLETNEPAYGWIFRNAFDINMAGQIAGNAWDGISTRAAIYDELRGFILLPRLQESPYREAGYRVDSINDNGEVIGFIQPSGYPMKTFLWTPTNPGTITVVEPVAGSFETPEGIGTNTFMMQDGTLEVLRLYTYSFVGGVPGYQLLDTIPVSYGGGANGNNTHLNEFGAFAYVTDDGNTQSLELFGPEATSERVCESMDFDLSAELQMNNSNDFVYVKYGDGVIPYLYRGSENRSYRLYDIVNSNAKSVLFADSSSGKLKPTANNTQGLTSVSDDDVGLLPSNDPFDTIAGSIGYVGDVSSYEAIILTPVRK
jgi:hypothetical protein